MEGDKTNVSHNRTKKTQQEVEKTNGPSSSGGIYSYHRAGSKVVVIGGTGHVGSYLVPRLVQAGYSVTVVSRGDRKPYFPHAAWDSVTRLSLDRNILEQNGNPNNTSKTYIYRYIRFKFSIRLRQTT